jgi:hypothetical protein
MDSEWWLVFRAGELALPPKCALLAKAKNEGAGRKIEILVLAGKPVWRSSSGHGVMPLEAGRRLLFLDQTGASPAIETAAPSLPPWRGALIHEAEVSVLGKAFRRIHARSPQALEIEWAWATGQEEVWKEWREKGGIELKRPGEAGFLVPSGHRFTFALPLAPPLVCEWRISPSTPKKTSFLLGWGERDDESVVAECEEGQMRGKVVGGPSSNPVNLLGALSGNDVIRFEIIDSSEGRRLMLSSASGKTAPLILPARLGAPAPIWFQAHDADLCWAAIPLLRGSLSTAWIASRLNLPLSSPAPR